MEDRNGVIAPFDEEVHGFGAEKGCVKAVEENGPAAALGMADFARKDGFLGGIATPVELEMTVTDHLDKLGPESLGGAAQDNVACGVGGFGFGAEFTPLFIDDAFSANDNDIFLKVVDVFDAFSELVEIGSMLGHQNDVGAAIG